MRQNFFPRTSPNQTRQFWLSYSILGALVHGNVGAFRSECLGSANEEKFVF